MGGLQCVDPPTEIRQPAIGMKQPLALTQIWLHGAIEQPPIEFPSNGHCGTYLYSFLAHERLIAPEKPSCCIKIWHIIVHAAGINMKPLFKTQSIRTIC